MKSIYLTHRFLYATGILILFFILAHSVPIMKWVAFGFLGLIILGMLYDIITLRQVAKMVSGKRNTIDKWSLGEAHIVKYSIQNHSNQSVWCHVYDESPVQLQFRKGIERAFLSPESRDEIEVTHRPIERGKYVFDKMLGYFTLNFPGIVSMQKVLDTQCEVMVYPSILQMRKYELEVFTKNSILQGIKRIRNIGEDDEFESIRPYVQGDLIKAINWKATSRRSSLMINQYQNTRSQEIYSIVDKGRHMKMPFYGMSLLDHAINSVLVISNIILKKYDKAGLITYGKIIDSVVIAEQRDRQLDLIISELYAQKTDFVDSNTELLYYTIRNRLKRRSILLFYTNFETPVDLERQLPYLRMLNKLHLLVVICFVNSEIEEESRFAPANTAEVYYKISLENSLYQKEVMAKTLRTNGIQCILTRPEDLNVNVINKYLEIKAMRSR